MFLASWGMGFDAVYVCWYDLWAKAWGLEIVLLGKSWCWGFRRKKAGRRRA